MSEVKWDEGGDCTFICFARLTTTGDVLLIYLDLGLPLLSFHAMPWGQDDIFPPSPDGMGSRFSFVHIGE